MRKYKIELNVDKWIVKKDHIKRLFDLFNKRFGRDSNLQIDIAFDQEEIPFKSFEEFDKCIRDEVNPLNKSVRIIRISARKLQRNSLRFATLNIYFDFDGFDFKAMGQGTTTVKDWTHGFKNDLDALFRSFKPDEELISLIKSKDTERYKNKSSVIFFDYEGRLKKMPKVKVENPSIIVTDSLIHLGQGDNVGGSQIKTLGKKDTFVEKLFWNVIITFIVGVAIIAVTYWIGIK